MVLHNSHLSLVGMWQCCSTCRVLCMQRASQVICFHSPAVCLLPCLRLLSWLQIIVDEAHHTVAASYKTVLEGLGLIEDLTPTPTPTPRAEVAGGKQQGEHSSDWADSSSSNSGGSKLDRNVLLETFGSMDDEDLSFEGSDSSSTSSRHGSFGSVNNKGSQQHKPLVRVLPNPDQLLLGFSATPYRLKVKESRHLYDIFNITYTRSIADMIRAGHLSEVSLLRLKYACDKGLASSGGRCCSSSWTRLTGRWHVVC